MTQRASGDDRTEESPQSQEYKDGKQRRGDEPRRLGESIRKPIPPSEELQAEIDRRIAEEEARELGLLERKAADRWEASGVPKRHRIFSAAHPDGPPAPCDGAYRELVEGIVNGETTIIVGPRGTGKTAMAVCGIRGHIFGPARGGGYYVRAADLFAEFQESFRDLEDGGSETALMGVYSQVGLLVIDDCQDQGHTEYTDRVLTRIVDRRYGEMLPTVLIGNETRAAAGEALGASIVSRVHEAGKIIECEWASFRKKK